MRMPLCVCVCLYVRACVCACLHVCVRVFVYVHACECVHACACVCTCVHACMHACCVCTRACIHTAPHPYPHSPPITGMGCACVPTPADPLSAVTMADCGTLATVEVTVEKNPGPGMATDWAVAAAEVAAYCRACPRRADAK